MFLTSVIVRQVEFLNLDLAEYKRGSKTSWCHIAYHQHHQHRVRLFEFGHTTTILSTFAVVIVRGPTFSYFVVGIQFMRLS
jgi:hypothetical protein